MPKPPPEQRLRCSRLLSCGCALASLALAVPSAAQETPAQIIAAHVRMQGYGCEKALDATRDNKASAPNEAVWTLRCSNASYRVRLVPDMADKVEPIK